MKNYWRYHKDYELSRLHPAFSFTIFMKAQEIILLVRQQNKRKKRNINMLNELGIDY